MNKLQITGLTSVAVAALLGCTTLPPANGRLEQARSDYLSAQNDPQTRDLAGGELKQAGDALTLADNAWAREDKPAEVEHLAYMVQQKVAIARETSNRKVAERVVTTAEAARDNVRLAARTKEVVAAQSSAASAQLDAAASQAQSAVSKREADDAKARNSQLEGMLVDMNAKQTARGMVITFGDLLFDTDQARLKAEGVRNVQKLADVLTRFPQRMALIEGFTDSTGSDSHNQELSGRRAESVRSTLVGLGIGRERIALQAYGESYPVASNENAGGRQLNRRVEIILSDDSGIIPIR